MNVKLRSDKKELLDDDNIPFADIQQNMKELNVINKYLGGHAITLSGFKKLTGKKSSLSVCEIGCGGGDNLAAIYQWSYQNNIHLDIIGIDMKDECIQFAKSNRTLPASAKWISKDYRAVKFDEKPDIIFSSLFCHHFTSEELVGQFQWMKENSTLGFFINDLQRNYLAYLSIKLLTSLFSSSYLVKNDAPISVLRGFHKSELVRICNHSNIQPLLLKWKWAFRYLLVYKYA
jgi:2-polyprenyl-3-methyl-5-hydroxy-6-metoxy-1,4-benzoquinol methylase